MTDRAPAFLWAGLPVYRCAHYPGCKYERVDNLQAVLEHETAVHQVVREALVVGPDGERLQVAEQTAPPKAQDRTPAPAATAARRRTRRAR